MVDCRGGNLALGRLRWQEVKWVGLGDVLEWGGAASMTNCTEVERAWRIAPASRGDRWRIGRGKEEERRLHCVLKDEDDVAASAAPSWAWPCGQPCIHVREVARRQLNEARRWRGKQAACSPRRSLLMLTAHLLLSFSLDSKQQLEKLHYYHLFNLTRSPTLLIRPTSNSKWLERSKVNNKGTCKLKTGFS
jgi:hypothetical protein